MVILSGQYYTMTETGEMLGVTRETIRHWLKKGKLKGQHVGNMVLIEKEEIARLQAGAVNDTSR